MAKPKKQPEVVEQIESENPTITVPPQFDPSLPESKQRHLR